MVFNSTYMRSPQFYSMSMTLYPPPFEYGNVYNYHGRDYFTVKAIRPSQTLLDMFDWCSSTFGAKQFKDEGDHWFSWGGENFCFSNEEHRTAFVLRWA